MARTIALGIIDAQRGFMPAAEGERLGIEGFGELPVADGELIVPVLNRILKVGGFTVFTTQDWHPLETAHFSPEPNYTTTWPVHCVADTPGARLHPLIELPEATMRFRKGFERLRRGEDDTSYTGYRATRDIDGRSYDSVERLLYRQKFSQIYLGGIALDYCVRATALDMRRAGYDVTVITDAVKPVAESSGHAAVAEMRQAGIRFIDAATVIEEIQGA